MRIKVPHLNTTIDMPEPGTMPRNQFGQLLQKRIKELQEPDTTPDVGIKAGLTPAQVTDVNRQLFAEQQAEANQRIANEELAIRQQYADAQQQNLALANQAQRLRLAEMLTPKPREIKLQEVGGQILDLNDPANIGREVTSGLADKERVDLGDRIAYLNDDGSVFKEVPKTLSPYQEQQLALSEQRNAIAASRAGRGGGSSSPYVSVGGALFNKLTGAFASPEEVAAARSAQINPDSPDALSPGEAITAREGAEDRVTGAMAASLKNAGINVDNADFLTEGADGSLRYNPQALIAAMEASNNDDLRRQSAYWQGVMSTIENDYRQGKATPQIAPYAAPPPQAPAVPNSPSTAGLVPIPGEGWVPLTQVDVVPDKKQAPPQGGLANILFSNYYP